MKKFRKIILLTLSLVLLGESYGQKRDTSNIFLKRDFVKLEKADFLQGGLVEGKKTNKFKGNVVLSHQGVEFHCDSAYQLPGENFFEAFSNVQVFQGDSITVTADHLIYDAGKRQLAMKGNVLVKNKKRIKKRKSLKYTLK